MIKIYYHNKDLDGFCSGAIANKFWLSKELTERIQMIGWDYGDMQPEINEGDYYILTDISFNPETMMRLNSTNCIWVDHHKSAILDSETYGYGNIPGIRKIGDSASLLAWRFFFKNLTVPEIVYWVDRYDVWKQGGDWDNVLVHQYGIRSTLGDPKDKNEFSNWDINFTEYQISVIVNKGTAITKFIEQQNKNSAKRCFNLMFEGLFFCAVNQGECNSEIVNSAITKTHDAIMCFRFTGIDWSVSMYDNPKNEKKHDLSLIAKRWMGGGHFSASGFKVKNIQDVIGNN